MTPVAQIVPEDLNSLEIQGMHPHRNDWGVYREPPQVQKHGKWDTDVQHKGQLNIITSWSDHCFVFIHGSISNTNNFYIKPLISL